MRRLLRALAFAGAVLAFGLGAAAQSSANEGYSRANLVAAERARGNDLPEATRIGRELFTTEWPVQVTKIRVDAVGSHRVAGLVLSGNKFHSIVTPDAFRREVVDLIARTLDASSVEEVDVWVTLPLPTYTHEVVAGDLAHPTFYIVYASTVRRAERATFAARVRRDEDVYWQPAWRATLAQP